MAKKKSKNFIIPSTFFIATTVNTEKQKGIHKSEPKQIVKEPKANYKASGIEKQPEKKNISKLSQGSKRKSALSLSSIQRNKIQDAEQLNKQKSIENLENLPKDSFNETTFLKVWNAYIEKLHLDGDKIFAAILKTDKPKIIDGYICVTYPNEMMKAELLRVKPKALKYLRQSLNNYSIDFKISVNEETAKRFAYTPQEKFEHLKSKNEAILILKKTFNLEL